MITSLVGIIASSITSVVYDPDAQAFFNAETAAGVTLTNSEKLSINNLVINLKAAGLWTKMKAIYPFISSTATSQKFNLKNPADTNAAFRLSFVGGWTHSTTGATPNGINGYANTFLSKTNLTELNTHISYYSRSNIVNLPAIDMGIFGSGSNTFTMLISFSGVFYLDMYDFNTNRVFINNSDSRGFYLGSRISSTSLKAYKNGVQFSSTNTNTSTGWAALNGNMTIGNRNDLPAGNYTNKECAFSSIGDGLTDLEAQVFNQIVEGYQFSLGRNINPAQSFYYNPSYNNETNAFLYSTQIVDLTTQGALNTLVNDMKTYGVWSKMKAVYPIVGSTSTTQKFNLINPQDTNAAFRLSFSGGWTHSSLGIQGNGTNAFADTFLQANIQMPSSLNNFHLSTYSRTDIDEGSIDIGAWTLTSLGQYTNLYLRTSNTFYTWINIDNNNAASTGVANTNSTGFFIGNRTASNILNGFRNGIKILDKTNSSSILQQYPFYIGAVNNRGLGGYNYSSRQTSFYSIGDGLTDSDAANFFYSVQKFQTTLGRNIGNNYPTVSDTDAQSFINTANITDLTQANAVNDLVIGLKADGIWTKMKAIYPMVGGSASSHSINLKTQSQFNLSFVGGWTHSNTGATPNGTNAYADTGLSPSTQLILYNTHISYYSRTNILESSNAEMGSYSGSGGNAFYMVFGRTGNLAYSFQYEQYTSSNFVTASGQSNSTGLWLSNRTSNVATTHKLWRNGLSLGNATTTSGSFLTNNIWIGAINNSNAGSPPAYYSKKECSFSSIGDGLTDTDATNLYSRVQTFQTTLGRAV